MIFKEYSHLAVYSDEVVIDHTCLCFLVRISVVFSFFIVKHFMTRYM